MNIQNKTSLISVSLVLVYTHPSMATNLLYQPGLSLSQKILTSLVLPAHNQGSAVLLYGVSPCGVYFCQLLAHSLYL